MEKKNIVIVVIIAIICALSTALFLIKSPKNGPVLIPEEQKTVIEQPAVESVLPTEETIKEDEGGQEQKAVEKPLSKPVVKPTTPISQTPVIKPIQVEEEKAVEVSPEKVVQDAGIIKDSDEIVITREFKSQSPSKYSFVGFGEQKAPTK